VLFCVAEHPARPHSHACLEPCSVVAILGTKYQSTAAPECLVRPVLRPALAILARGGGVHRLIAWAGFLAGRHRHSPALLFRAAECPRREPQTTQDVGPRRSRSSPSSRLSLFVTRLLAPSRSHGYRPQHRGPSDLKLVLLELSSPHRDRLRVNVSAPAASAQIPVPNGLLTTREMARRPSSQG
jgi:hypothetical protein